MDIASANQQSRALMDSEHRAKVLLLGTFHFGNSGLDEFSMTVDMLTEQRQVEIVEVVELLAAFRPTKIAVEMPLDSRGELHQQYSAYRAGNPDLPPSEVFQIGFRLASWLGHERLYPIDAWAYRCDSEEGFLAYVSELGITEENFRIQVNDPGRWERFPAWLQYQNERLLTSGLREHLRWINSEEQIRLTHGIYLAWPAAEPGDYRAADFVTGWWYNRNLRIYANLTRITESPEDRILVIYGSGHIPILQHCVEMSYEHELVPVSNYL